MSANPIWIAGYFGPVAGAAPVWIAPGDGTVPSAVQSQIVSYFAPVAGATAVWIAGFFAPPPVAIGATPITISGWSGSGGGGSGGSTSVWSASDAAANAMTLSNGGLTVQQNAATAGTSIRGTVSKTTGKLYIEFFITANAGAGNQSFGLASASFNSAGLLGVSNYSGGIAYAANHVSSGFTGGSYQTLQYAQVNDVIMLAVDFGTGNMWIGKNNGWSNSSNPATGSLPIMSFVSATVGALFPAMTLSELSEVWTLQSTAASQKYAPPSGFSAWDSAAPTHSAQALAYLARTVGGNEGGNATNIAALIDGLVSDGVWAKLDALYVLAQQNQSDALLNLVGTSYGLTGSLAKPGPRALTFAPYVGFSGFASGLDTGFNPSAATSPNFSQNNASLGVWSYSVIDEGKAQIADSGSSYIYNKFGGLFYPRVNDSTTSNTVATSITSGLFTVERNDAANMHPYQNGASAGPLASTSTAIPSSDFFVGGNSVTGVTTQTLSAAHIGASLGAAGQLALYNRLRTYMTAVGVP